MEGGIRVPLLVQWPGHVPAGVTSPLWAATVDLLPTFLGSRLYLFHLYHLFNSSI